MHVLSAVPSIFPRPPVSIPPTRSSLHEVADLLGVRDSLAFSNDEVYFDHVQARAGQRLHLAGQAFEHLYLVHTGFLKTALLDASGAEQVVAFPLHGDLIGTDGIATLHYPSETTALSDSTLVVLPMQVIRSLGRSHPHLAPALYGVMGGALERDPGRVRLRATGNALGRLAGFLLATAQRYARLGYAPTLLVLRMTRSDIASYLFMTVETVSRALRTLEDRQLVEIDRRTVRLRDPAGLAQLTRGPE